MSARSQLSGILHMLIAAMLTRDLDTQEASDSTQSSDRNPVSFLPVSYKIHGADYFLLKEAGQEIMRNSSVRSHTQPFVILRVQRPPVATVTYGLFSTEQEIPLNLIPLALPLPSPSVFRVNWRVQFFVLTSRVQSSNPKVRVLFYIPGHELYLERTEEWNDDKPPCIVVYLYAFWQTKEVRGSCVISGRSGLCVAELDPPVEWFGPAQGNQLELYYQAKPETSSLCRGQWVPQVNYDPVTPMQRIGSVRLLQVRPGATPDFLLKLGDAVIVHATSRVLQKNDVISFLIYVKPVADLERFSLSVIVRNGLTFRRATPTNKLLWDATVDAVSKDEVGVTCKKQPNVTGKRLSKLQSILQMDFEVDEVRSLLEVQVIKWELMFPDDDRRQRTPSEGFMNIYTSQRNFVGLAPLVMDAELMNTAILTGKRVVVPVRTVAVETDGSVTDVTDFTDCNSTDEDVLKVSDRCDHVYVNGKETRGRVRMLVNFTYSYMSAQLEMNVWFPRFPLDIEVSDAELNPIKGWRIPVNSKKSSLSWSSEEEKRGRGCTLQFQHALVRVLTNFVAEHSDPRQPQAFFLGSDWLVDVTKMVQFFMKVEDSSVARLQEGTVLSGQDVGTTSIKVLSPLSDSILAEKSVSVSDERVSITELGLQLVSGLALQLQLSTGSNRAISATATTQEVLNTPKQKAVLSSWLQFSDGSITPLDIYDSAHYLLNVTSQDEGVVSVRDSPSVVVTEGEGQGELIRAEMSIRQSCQKMNRKSTLALGSANITVKFGKNKSVGGASSKERSAYDMEDEAQDQKSRSESKSEESAMWKITTKSTIQDPDARRITDDLETGTNNDASDGLTRPGNILNHAYFVGLFKPNTSGGNLDEETTGNAPGNLMNYNVSPVHVEVPIQEPKNTDHDSFVEEPLANHPLAHLEIGMYVLLCVFCLAILAFLSNLVLHLVKFRHKPTVPEQIGNNWMWLRTDAQELIINETHSTAGINMGANAKPCGTPAERTSCQVASVGVDLDLSCAGYITMEPGRSESPNSPTSRRKKVQFTTFASTDCINSLGTIPRENGHGIPRVGNEENFGTPNVPRTESTEQL
ncbi:transmembrane protein 132D [Trichomycterus rosablanca]|uniref:transmembrane protein 132D n=1 Tax=Trichomycterus rosablanca TaxID=2290929 RepID=UPI002F34EF88